jgi:glycosyltransferase involved in cell wall biosynthesis
LQISRYFFWQIKLFIELFRALETDDLVLINTCLPFSAAIAAKIKGCKCIYYLHEDRVGSAFLSRFLFFTISHFATGVIFVSKYLKRYCSQFNFPRGKVLYNPTVFDKSELIVRDSQFFSVLMLSSFKPYKGVDSFVKLAEMNPSITWTLVLSSDGRDVCRFIDQNRNIKNLTIFSKQSEVEGFYQKASVVINLTNPDECVETFGMTVLEGFSFGLPALVPYIGGIAEVVVHNDNGFHINPNNLHEVSNKLIEIMEDPALYHRLSLSAHNRFDDFTEFPIVEVLSELIKDE